MTKPDLSGIAPFLIVRKSKRIGHALVAFQFVIEDDAADECAVFAQPFAREARSPLRVPNIYRPVTPV
jgi:hypothetical protein